MVRQGALENNFAHKKITRYFRCEYNHMAARGSIIETTAEGKE